MIQANLHHKYFQTISISALPAFVAVSVRSIFFGDLLIFLNLHGIYEATPILALRVGLKPKTVLRSQVETIVTTPECLQVRWDRNSLSSVSPKWLVAVLLLGLKNLLEHEINAKESKV